jgi:hypothetical protein
MDGRRALPLPLRSLPWPTVTPVSAGLPDFSPAACAAHGRTPHPSWKAADYSPKDRQSTKGWQQVRCDLCLRSRTDICL